LLQDVHGLQTVALATLQFLEIDEVLLLVEWIETELEHELPDGGERRQRLALVTRLNGHRDVPNPADGLRLLLDGKRHLETHRNGDGPAGIVTDRPVTTFLVVSSGFHLRERNFGFPGALDDLGDSFPNLVGDD
jgi:hypothetical protein